MELNHNIGFAIGDCNWGGHCRSINYHLISNYSVKDITKAYIELSKELKWDFIKECREDTGKLSPKAQYIIYTLKIRSTKEINENIARNCSGIYVIEDSDEYIEIFFKLVKTKLPDLEWYYRNLQEEYLTILDGAAYGLFEN